MAKNVVPQRLAAILAAGMAGCSRRRAWRVDIDFGDIHERDDGTVYGAGVNAAARLEGAGRARRQRRLGQGPRRAARQDQPRSRFLRFALATTLNKGLSP
jgi:hypothetical protein